MLGQSRGRNRAEVRSGRLVLIQGDVTALGDLAPLDLVYATHVLYFWHQPDEELRQIHRALRPGGRLGLGYQLRHLMPGVARKTFPTFGHRLYDDDDEVARLLTAAGFQKVDIALWGPPESPHGRLALAESEAKLTA
jgi:SAM-dependent methyltransferase